jgi:hypothetical protein
MTLCLAYFWDGGSLDNFLPQYWELQVYSPWLVIGWCFLNFHFRDRTANCTWPWSSSLCTGHRLHPPSWAGFCTSSPVFNADGQLEELCQPFWFPFPS